MAEVPSAGDSQHQSTPPGSGAPGLGGPGGPEGPEGPGRPEDDWDQEASLAAFVAEVEAKRAHGLIDIDDYYDLEMTLTTATTCRMITAGPTGLLLDGRHQRQRACPATRPPGLLPGGRSRMWGFCPGARMAAGMMVVLVATAVRGSPRAEYGTRRCQGQAWLRLLMRPPVLPGAMGTPVTMN